MRDRAQGVGWVAPRTSHLEPRTSRCSCPSLLSMPILSLSSDDSAVVPAIRRAWISLVLALVLSALELDRRSLPAEPAAIVHLLESPPEARRRGRPYRAHYRHSGVTSRNIGNPSSSL